jgi:hypothetical protein
MALSLLNALTNPRYKKPRQFLLSGEKQNDCNEKEDGDIRFRY